MAHPDWNQINIATILNNETANTAEIARFDRIMQYRNAEATNGLSNRLVGVAETIYRASQLAEARAEKAIPKLDDAIALARVAIQKADEAAEAQSKQQWAMIALTIALVVCTAAYTGINGWAAYQTREGNKIQAQVAAAALQQASAARDANEIQRKALHFPEK